MRLSVWAVCLCWCLVVFWPPPQAWAEGSVQSFSGTVLPTFQLSEDGKIYCTIPESLGDPFCEKNVLYCIDPDTMSAEKVFSVRNRNSKIFVDSGKIYFQHPDSLLSGSYIYGDYKWYSIDLDAPSKSRKNWTLLGEYSQKNEFKRVYFPTTIGVFCWESRDRKNYEKFLRCHENEVELICEVGEGYVGYGHTFLMLGKSEGEKKELFMTIYDVAEERFVEIPHSNSWYPDVIIVDNMLYYTDEYVVRSYDISAQIVTTVFESECVKWVSLCYDDGLLYIIEYQNNDRWKVLEYSTENVELLRTIHLPEEILTASESLIVDGKLLCYSTLRGEISVFDLNSGDCQRIRLRN